MWCVELDECFDDINCFEVMLVNEGVLVLKFWFYFLKDGQKQCLKVLEKDLCIVWWVIKESYDCLKIYNKLQEVVGYVLCVSNMVYVLWIIVEGIDDEYCLLIVGCIVFDLMKCCL